MDAAGETAGNSVKCVGRGLAPCYYQGAANWELKVSAMRTIFSTAIIIIAAVPGFFMGAGMNQAMGGAALFAAIAGFACTIQAIERMKKP